MTYLEARRWSEQHTRDVLLPFLSERETELPFRGLHITQDAPGLLERGIDMIAKADAIASRNGRMCLVSLRCQKTGFDERTITVRWPKEYEAHAEALRDPTLMRVGYMIHSYSVTADGPLVCVYVAEMQRVIEEIDRSWDRSYPTPYLKRAVEDDQPFAVPGVGRIGALRLAPDDMPTLF